MNIDLTATRSPEEVWIEDMPKYRLHGNKAGRKVSIGQSDEYMSLKRGYPIFITGQPHSGKTEFAFEVVLQDIRLNGAKWFVLSTEAGSTVELYGQLAEKWQAKGGDIFKSSKYAMTDEEVETSMMYFQKHIRTIDPDEEWGTVTGDIDLNLQNIFDVIEREEEYLGAKFDGILIDPFNDLELDETKATHTQVKDEVRRLIRFGKRTNKTIALTIHANDTKPMLMGNGANKFYHYPPARPQELQGGQQFFRKGYQIIQTYRPSQAWVEMQMDNPDVMQNEGHRMLHAKENNNMTTVIIQKSKPKGVGKVGSFNIFYDKIRQRYYDVNEIGERFYSNGDKLGKITPKPEQSQIKPNTDFLNEGSNDKAPF